MKKKSNWRTILATLIMVLPFVLGFGSMTDVMAATAVSAEQLVTIHKLQYDSLPGNPTQNTGDEMDFSGKPLAGAVFTAYDVTAVYWAAYDKAEGNDGLKTAAAEAAVRALTNDDLGKGTAFPETNADGIASLPLATKVEVGVDEEGKPIMRNAIYLFKETKSPAGVVQSKSADFILGLPVYNEGTDNAKDEVHVYPKNEVKAVTFGFTKYGVDETGSVKDENGKDRTLNDAAFVLKDTVTGGYYSLKNGQFDTTEEEAKNNPITSKDGGMVSVEDLVLKPGTYEFYEVNSTVSTDGSEEAEYHYGKNPVVIVTVDENMNVTYDYYNIDGKMTDETKGQATGAEAYNYKVPAPTKDANDKDVDVDQEIIFTITQQIPTDIADYTQFQLVDDFDDSLELLSTVGEIEGQLTEFGGKVTVDGSKFTVDFDMDLLKANAGKTITFEVKMSVKKGAELATDINNEVTFDNNFDDQSAKDSVKTYGKKFLKIDADSKNPLANAEFHVLNPEGKLLGMITKEDGTKVQAWGAEGDAGFEATVLKSNAQGEFEVSGLAKTDEKGAIIYYELKEIKAPEGYALAQNTFKFVADDGTATIKINNKHKGSLPSTGGKGIVAFVAVGVVAIAGAGLYFMKGRKHIEG
ncbi:SpaH/EbpB family LPXTG-anchored major pilin [Enterococcus asini]|uniref:SpaH/EbpB family LPXTG-anchored major pilin n=1 Tax=Enterococcus asini TaxID=57732 RepID=UPI0028916DE6|nr:SpaH/EbpB family LPXTG-anchored major pilin [Enterococcus asini]MDT2744633.1 SpaH/EbpB family LPXTG-anchored major pilin [Enterococcus asini]